MIGPQIVPTEWTNRLANLIHTIRPDWEENGIAAALRKVADRPLAHVVVAAITAATERTDQRTPAVIATDGNHWRVGVTRTADQPPRAQRCPHDVVGHCDACHGELPTPERIREIRAEFTKAKHPYEPDPTSVVLLGEVTDVIDTIPDDQLPF